MMIWTSIVFFTIILQTCHVLADDEVVNAMLMVPTDKMKSLARKYFKTKKMGGDDKQSKFVLIPLKEVFNG